jgi:hypothetical protein
LATDFTDLTDLTDLTDRNHILIVREFAAPYRRFPEPAERVTYSIPVYDFIRWDPECPAGQIVSVPDGYYRITAYTTPVVGSRGDRQDVWLHFEACPERPRLAWTGVPDLSGDAP